MTSQWVQRYIYLGTGLERDSSHNNGLKIGNIIKYYIYRKVRCKHLVCRPICLNAHVAALCLRLCVREHSPKRSLCNILVQTRRLSRRLQLAV